MRAYIVLCLIASTYAGQLGYNYQSTNEAPAYAAPSAPAALYSAPSAAAPSYAAPAPAASSYTAPAAAAPSYTAPEAAQSVAAPAYTAPQAELEKEYYSFSVNEGDFIEPASSDQVSNGLKKNLQVVFIKGPDNRGIEDAALALAKQAGEQQTAIYVLNKQADIGDLANRLNANRGNQNSKPEVHFVKYRTPEDAAHAQQAIQSQYDQLGGSSQSHNGGVAPVLNFASQAAAPAQESYSAPAASAPSSAYLPANILRRLRL